MGRERAQGSALAELLLTGKPERVLVRVPWVGPQISLRHWCSEARLAGLGRVSPSPGNLGGVLHLGETPSP